MKRISIITVALNEAGNISRLKGSIEAVKVPSGWAIETVLVDNGSNDGTADLARERGYDVIVSMPKGNLAECRNAGISAAKGNWLAFVDADCELDCHWLVAFVPLISDAPALMGWPVQPPHPGTWVQRAWHAHWSQRMQCNPSRINNCTVVATDAFRMICSGNMAFSRSLIEEIGVFNELLHTGEDSEFALRSDLNGCEVLGVPGMVVTHHGEPATLCQFYRQQVWHMNRQAYLTGAQATRGRRGLNALYFTLAYGCLLLLAALAVILAIIMQYSLLLIPAVLFPLFLVGLSVRTALRSNSFAIVPALTAIYFVYGLARLAKLTGLARSGRSWRALQNSDSSNEIGVQT